MKKKIIIAVILCAAIVFAALAAVYHAAFNSIKIESVQAKVTSFSDYDLQYVSRFIDEHRVNNTNAVEYLNKNISFTDGKPSDYCYVELTCKIKNSGKFEIIPVGLIPQKDNDVIGFSEADLKDASLLPGETREEKTVFACRRSGMTDDEIIKYAAGIKYKLLQKHRHLGSSFSVVSLKDIIK